MSQFSMEIDPEFVKRRMAERMRRGGANPTALGTLANTLAQNGEYDPVAAATAGIPQIKFAADPYMERKALASQAITPVQQSTPVTPAPDIATPATAGAIAGGAAQDLAGKPNDALLRARYQRLNELYNSANESNRKAQIYNSYNAGKGDARALVPQDEIMSYKKELDQLGSYFAKAGQANDLTARQAVSPATRAAKARELDIQALKNVTLANKTGDGMETDPDLIAKLQGRLANPYAPAPDKTDYTGRLAGLGVNQGAAMETADKTQSDRINAMKLRDDLKAKAGTLANAGLDTALAEQKAKQYAFNNPVTDIKQKMELDQYSKAFQDQQKKNKLATHGFDSPEAVMSFKNDLSSAIDTALDAGFGNSSEDGMAVLNNELLPRLKELSNDDPETAKAIVRNIRTKLAMSKTGFWNKVGQFAHDITPDIIRENTPSWLNYATSLGLPIPTPGGIIEQAKRTHNKMKNTESILRQIESTQ